jgi:hypothetical protein
VTVIFSSEELRESPALPVRLATENTTDESEYDLRREHIRAFSDRYEATMSF